MRIGTWNLEGRWTTAHAELIESLDCDLLLLTEVADTLALDDYFVHRTATPMTARHTWSAVASREQLTPLADPHFATALAVCGEWTVASSVLPWRGGGAELYGDGSTAEKTIRTLDTLLAAFPRDRLIWGGDWNHALSGREHPGGLAGRTSLQQALAELDLIVPTAELPHRIDGLTSIDHIAIPAPLAARSAHVDAVGLSDHDAYVTEF